MDILMTHFVGYVCFIVLHLRDALQRNRDKIFPLRCQRLCRRQVASIVMEEDLDKSDRLSPVHDTQDAGTSQSVESNTGDSYHYLDAGSSSIFIKNSGSRCTQISEYRPPRLKNHQAMIQSTIGVRVNYDCVSSPLGADLPKKKKKKFWQW